MVPPALPPLGFGVFPSLAAVMGLQYEQGQGALAAAASPGSPVPCHRSWPGRHPLPSSHPTTRPSRRPGR